jgi:hypothetical protein
LLALEKQDDIHAQQHCEIGDAAEVMQICVFCFIHRWTAMLCSKFFLQSSIWKLELLEGISLLHFQFAYLPRHLVCKHMAALAKYPAQSSFGIFGFRNHHCLLIFL